MPSNLLIECNTCARGRLYGTHRPDAFSLSSRNASRGALGEERLSKRSTRPTQPYLHTRHQLKTYLLFCVFFWFCSLARVAYRHRRTGIFLNLSRLYRHRLLDDEKDDNSNSIVDIHHLLHHQRHHHNHHHQRIIVGQAVLNWRTSNTVVCATHPACIRHGVIGLLVVFFPISLTADTCLISFFTQRLWYIPSLLPHGLFFVVVFGYLSSVSASSILLYCVGAVSGSIRVFVVCECFVTAEIGNLSASAQ